MEARLCLVDGCDLPVSSKGYCSRHYQSLRIYGDPIETTRRIDAKSSRTCSIDGCGGKHFSGAWCSRHFQMNLRHGDPLHADKNRKPCRIIDHPSYSSYVAAKIRCENPKHDSYSRYGGRGIKVCGRWRSDFWAFVADMGEKQPGQHLDRIDPDKDYEPGNCRWAGASENSRRKTNNVLDEDAAIAIRSRYASGGVTMAALSADFGCSIGTIHGVIHHSTWAKDRRLKAKRVSAAAQQAWDLAPVYGNAKKHPLYHTWKQIKARCRRRTCTSFSNYGARGIRVCDEWANDFWAFARDVGVRPTSGHSLDRIDNDGHYEPGNVRWATRTEQLLNRRGGERKESGQ